MTNDNDAHKSKELLQQQVEAKRDEIANTVDEIRVTLTDEMRERKQAMKEAMDWRYYVKKQPVACVGGAAAVGFFVGKMLTNKIMEADPEPDWTDRLDNLTHGASRKATRKLDEWRGRAEGESKWKARSRSMVSSGSDLLMRELAKAARQMILPTVIAAVTGKMASDNKTTVVEKHVHKNQTGLPDHEVTTNVTELDGKEAKQVKDSELS